MENQEIQTSLVPSYVEHNNQRVVTTEQLAKFYGCKVIQIQQNFNNNKDKFIEGKHYYKIDGEDLKNFKKYAKNIEMPISPMTRQLYLWTKQGVIHHFKIINSNHAWAVLEILEEHYFNTDFFNKLRDLSANINESDLKCVYAFEMENGTVKIGYTKDIRRRMQTIISSSGLDIVNVYATDFVDSEVAYTIEQACHETFEDYRIRGEFFKISFAEARAELDKYSAIIEELNRTGENFNNQILFQNTSLLIESTIQ